MNFGSLSDTYLTLNKNNQSQTVTLENIGDNNYEDHEDLWLDATVVSKTDLDEVRTESGYGEILNDDEQIVKKDITFYLGGASNTEGGPLVFDLEISDVLDKDINIELETVLNGSATSSDLQSKTAYVKIPAGSKTGMFVVNSTEDTEVENTETFSVRTTGKYSYTGTDLNSINGLSKQVTGTIIDDDTQNHLLKGDAHAANILKDGKYFRFEREVA